MRRTNNSIGRDGSTLRRLLRRNSYLWMDEINLAGAREFASFRRELGGSPSGAHLLGEGPTCQCANRPETAKSSCLPKIGVNFCATAGVRQTRKKKKIVSCNSFLTGTLSNKPSSDRIHFTKSLRYNGQNVNTTTYCLHGSIIWHRKGRQIIIESDAKTKRVRNACPSLSAGRSGQPTDGWQS